MAYQSDFEKLKRRYDEKPEQWFAALAEAHRKLGELDRAISIVQAGIQQRPNYVSGHIVLGRCLVDQGDDDGAERVFEEVLELDAENIIALKVLGDVAERRGNREAARRWLGRLLEVDPMNDEARIMLDRVSQLDPTPVDEPVSSESSIVTESAARAAGVASRPSAADESDTAPVEPIDIPDVVESAPEPAVSEPAAEFVIERTSEAIEVVDGDEDQQLSDAFAAIDDAELRQVSFDEPGSSESSEASPEGEGDLAAGTLDFIAAELEPGDQEPRTLEVVPPEPETSEAKQPEEPAEVSEVDSDAEVVSGLWGDSRPEVSGDAPLMEQVGEIFADSGPTAFDDEDTSESVEAEEVQFEEIPVAASDEVEFLTTDDVEAPAAPANEAAPKAGEGSSPSVTTETMAEVYASQGLFDQAMDVYRMMLSEDPDNESLRSKLAALEQKAAERSAGIKESSRREFSASATGGVSVGTMLAILLTERPGQPSTTDDDVVFVTPSEPSPLERAFGDGVSGEPAHRADDEPSLAALFGEGGSGEGKSKETDGGGDSESDSLTYEGFYGSDSESGAESAEAGDDEEFKAWLRSLRS